MFHAPVRKTTKKGLWAIIRSHMPESSALKFNSSVTVLSGQVLSLEDASEESDERINNANNNKRQNSTLKIKPIYPLEGFHMN